MVDWSAVRDMMATLTLDDNLSPNTMYAVITLTKTCSSKHLTIIMTESFRSTCMYQYAILRHCYGTASVTCIGQNAVMILEGRYLLDQVIRK